MRIICGFLPVLVRNPKALSCSHAPGRVHFPWGAGARGAAGAMPGWMPLCLEQPASLAPAALAGVKQPKEREKGSGAANNKKSSHSTEVS